MGQMLRHGSRAARQTMQPSATPRTASANADAVAQALRYGASMLEIRQNAGIAIANVAAAQLQGRSDDLELLSRSAHEDALHASENAMAATGTAITRGLGDDPDDRDGRARGRVCGSARTRRGCAGGRPLAGR
jgi:hypothetical protein